LNEIGNEGTKHLVDALQSTSVTIFIFLPTEFLSRFILQLPPTIYIQLKNISEEMQLLCNTLQMNGVIIS